MKKNQILRRLFIILLWVALWQILSGVIHSRIIFAGPGDTFRALFVIVTDRGFYVTVGHSLCRIGAGFLLGFLGGIVLAALSETFSLVGEVLDPFVRVLQAVPVASFVILALIWVGSAHLAVMISFLIVLPVIYRNVKAGIAAADVNMREMGKVYRMSRLAMVRYIYIPELMPYLRAASKTGVGMAWKSGIAAEVIGVPALSLGERLYMAKIYLATEELFAWTVVIILISHLFEWAFLHLLTLLEALLKRGPSVDLLCEPEKEDHSAAITVRHLTKRFGEKTVLQDVNLQFERGGRYCLMGASGRGKTTLIRLMMGLEHADEGSITCGVDAGFERRGWQQHIVFRRGSVALISAAFQEDRLFPYMTGAENIRAVSRRGTWFSAEVLLKELQLAEALTQRVDEMSGGMKRRVALARALACPSGIVILDEPFNGLDEATRKAALGAIERYLAGRTLILITHQKEDALQLGAQIVTLTEEA